MEVSKIKTYVGFSIKAGKAVFGAENAMKRRSRVALIDKSISDNTLKSLLSLYEKQGTEYFFVDGLELITHKTGCKVIGIRDEHLAKAIREELKGEKSVNE